MPEPDDGIVSAHSQIGEHVLPHECPSYGTWRGAIVVPGFHVRYAEKPQVINAMKWLLDGPSRVRIVAPDPPNEQCGSQPCSLKIELIHEYLPATTNLYVTMHRSEHVQHRL